MSNKTSSSNKRVLFINDGSIINPIISSQGLPHLSLLAEKGFQIFILSVESPKKGFEKEEYERIRTKYQKKITLITIPVFPQSYLRSSTQLLLLGPLITLFIVLRYHINFIHARSYIPAFISLVTKKLLGTKFIFDMRGLFVEEYVSKGATRENSLLARVLRYFERECLLKANDVVVVSEQFKRHVENLPYIKSHYTKIKIHSIPNSADTNRFQIKPNSSVEAIRERFNLKNRPVLMYSGSLASWQLPDMVVNFFRIFQEFVPQSFLLFITHDDPRYVQDLLFRYRIPDANYYITKAKFDDVPDYLSLARIGILLRHDDVLNKVSCPTKFAEYLSAGVPVLLTKGIGDTESIVNEHNVGVVIQSISENDFRNAVRVLIKFLNEEKKSQEDRCKEIAQKYFSLSDAVEKYYNIYTNVDY